VGRVFGHQILFSAYLGISWAEGRLEVGWFWSSNFRNCMFGAWCLGLWSWLGDGVGFGDDRGLVFRGQISRFANSRILVAKGRSMTPPARRRNLGDSYLGGRSPPYNLPQSLACISGLLSMIADSLASLQENSFQIVASGGMARGCDARFFGDARRFFDCGRDFLFFGIFLNRGQFCELVRQDAYAGS
jgi:hypothetical protein